LDQAWFRKILTLGLFKEFKTKDSEIGRCLKMFFGLDKNDPLSPEEINDCYTDDLMTIKPINEIMDEFFDYILQNYI
jgi:hypothetical protein